MWPLVTMGVWQVCVDKYVVAVLPRRAGAVLFVVSLSSLEFN